MKTLIVYYSFTGNNDMLANCLKQQLNCEMVKIETTRKRNGISVFLDIAFNRKPSLKPIRYQFAKYDHLIFVAPVWAGKIAMPLKALLMKEAQNIKRYSFISICGGGNKAQKNNITQQLIAAIGHKPDVITELWMKKVIDLNQSTGVHHDRLKMKANDIDVFKREIDGFIEALSRTELQLT